MGIAAQVAARGRLWPKASAGPLSGRPAPTYPSVPLQIAVELYLGGAWVDITPYVRYRNRIKIYRGRRDEQTQAAPAYCTLTLNNTDGRFSPRNASGAYYGLIGRNVKFRVRVNPGSGFSTRFTGVVSEWPPRWIPGDGERWVNIRADGTLRRLGQGKGAAKSAMRRKYDNDELTPFFLVNYWPLEGGQASTDLFDVVNEEPTSIVPFNPFNTDDVGSPRFGSVDLAPGSDFVVDISGSWRLDLYATPYESTGAHCVRTVFNIGTSKFETGQLVSYGIRMQPYVSPVHFKYDVYFGSDSVLYVNVIESNPNFDVVAGPTTVLSTTLDDAWDGNARQVTITMSDIGGTSINMNMFLNGVLIDTAVYVATVAGLMDQPVWRIGSFTTNGASSTTGFGHVALYSSSVADAQGDVDFYEALYGHPGELATDRFARICTEEGIEYTIDEVFVENQGMGAQSIDPPLDLLRDCEDVNEGLIDEDLDGSLRLSSRTFRYNREIAFQLDYLTQVMQPFEPTDDDLLIRNDWTISRRDGATKQYVKTSGPLNVSDPDEGNDGVGRYDESATLSLEDDQQPIQHASWRVHKGTVDEQRFPRICLNFAKSPELIDAYLAADISSRFLIVNAPADTGPTGQLDQVIEYVVEYIDPLFWEVELTGSPYASNRVAVLGDVVLRLDCGASTLAEVLDTTETGIDLSIADLCYWTHDYGDYVITVDREDMLVTAVSAAAGSAGAYTQTLTVTRSYNGVVATHNLGAEVHVRDPIIPAL